MINNIFTLEGDFPVLSPEARLISYFNEIYKNEDSVIGKSPDGKSVRFKPKANIKIAYVYYMVNTELFPAFKEEQRVIRIKNLLKIDYEIEKDPLVKKAIEELTEDSKYIEDKLIDALESTFESTLDLIKPLEQNNRQLLSFLQRDVSSLMGDELTQRKMLIDSIREDSRKNASFINELISSINKIKDLRLIQEKKRRDNNKKGELSLLETNPEFYKRKV